MLYYCYVDAAAFAFIFTSYRHHDNAVTATASFRRYATMMIPAFIDALHRRAHFRLMFITPHATPHAAMPLFSSCYAYAMMLMLLRAARQMLLYVT